jgi:hypothetical protein
MSVYGELLAAVHGFLTNQELAPGDRALLEQYRSKYLYRLEWWRAPLHA